MQAAHPAPLANAQRSPIPARILAPVRRPVPRGREPEPGRKLVIKVEDWAEIRRLHRAERLPIGQSVFGERIG